MDYEKEIIIDCDALDIEWLDQPNLMLKYGRHEAAMHKVYDQAKESLELVKAELDRKIRESPKDYGVPKITEASVLNLTITQEEFKEANSKLINARFELNNAKAAVAAFEQRKVSLENLVKLHGQQYFAGPKVPRDLTFEAQKKKKVNDSNDRIATKLTRTIK